MHGTTISQDRGGAAAFTRSLDENGSRGDGSLEVRLCESGEATIRAAHRAKRSSRRRWDQWSQIERMIADVENKERSVRRTRGKMRRYCVHNLLRYMWVLTFEEAVVDHRDAMREVHRFIRRMRRELGVDAYLFAPEPHPGGHGWHVNLFVSRRYAHADIRRVWGRGHVWVKDWGRDRRYGPLRERVRAAAGYASKYAGKDLAELSQFSVRTTEREHRYEVGRGWRPRSEATRATTLEAALAIVAARGRFLRIIDCDDVVGGGLWIRYSPNAPPDAERPPDL